MPADRQTNMKTETFITILHISGSEEVAAVQDRQPKAASPLPRSE